MSRIVIDCRMYSTKFTGIGKYTQELIKNLAELKSNHEFLLLFNSDEYKTFTPPAANFHKIEVNCPIYSLKEQTKLPLFLYQLKPDLVHFTHFNAPILYFKKQITTIHDLTLNHDKGRKFSNLAQRFAYQLTLQSVLFKSKKIITVSKSTANDLAKTYPFTKKKIQTIYLGLDEIYYKPELQTSHLPDLPKNYILYTGNWRSHKNLPNLIKAFFALKKDYKYSGKLVLTGRPDDKYPETLEKISELGLEQDVIKIGLVPDATLPALYHKAEAYVFPSLYEGFGLPILEAFATATPVVASNIDTLNEIGGEAILTFNPIDPQDIAHKTNMAITDKNKRTEMITSGLARLKDFSFEKMARQTLDQYNSIL